MLFKTQQTIIPYCLLLLFFCFSCSTTNENNNNKRTINYPDTLWSIKNNLLFKTYTKGNLDSSKLTIITTIWGECHLCMAKFKEWEKILSKELFKRVQMVYIVTTPYPDYFLKVFYPEIKYSGVLLIDNSDSFYSLNNLKYSQQQLNTFLVDGTFRIILQGDPLIIPDMLKQYEKAIKSNLNN